MVEIMLGRRRQSISITGERCSALVRIHNKVAETRLGLEDAFGGGEGLIQLWTP